jgi:hypothetical protein
MQGFEMTNNNHTITPPPELVKQWVSLACEYEGDETWIDLATQAARWGADQELKACYEWVVRDWTDIQSADMLLHARRPKPPSLKELALESVKRFEKSGEFFSDQMRELEFIRKALETIDD